MGNQALSLPYDVGDELEGFQALNGWRMFQGNAKGKKDNLVSVFRFNKKDEEYSRNLACAQNFLKRLKTLRHPCILAYLDGVETENEICIITEHVNPLGCWLQDNQEKSVQRTDAVTWGLQNVFRGLGFLNDDCKLIHGCISPWSIFVTEGGDWKLGGFDLVGEQTDSGPCRILRDNHHMLPSKYCPPERVSCKWGFLAKRKAPCCALDSWSLGCVINEIFEGSKDVIDVRKSKNIPSALRRVYNTLVEPEPSSRVSVKGVVEKCRYFTQNPLVRALVFMNEMQLKENTEKMVFFKKILADIERFPKSVSCYKILPATVNALRIHVSPSGQSGNASASGSLSAAMLSVVLKLGALLDSEEEYQRLVVPSMVDLWGCNDRTTRVALLQSLPDFVEHLDSKMINKTIFERFCTGFQDTSPILREMTVKASVHVAPHLNDKNINTTLMRHFARLQSDVEPSIRTNTAICVSLIVSHLSATCRKKVLVAAFARAVRDPFPQCRVAGLKGLASCKTYLEEDPANIATKVLPGISPSLVDSSPEVRAAGFDTINILTKLLRVLSDARAEKQRAEAAAAAAQAQTSNPNNADAKSLSNTIPEAGKNKSGYLSMATGWAASSIGWKKGNTESSMKSSTAAPFTPSSKGMDAVDNNNNNSFGQDSSAGSGWDSDEIDFNDEPTTVTKTKSRSAAERKEERERKRLEIARKREERRSVQSARKGMSLKSNKKQDPKKDDDLTKETWGWDNDDDDLFASVETEVKKPSVTPSTPIGGKDRKAELEKKREAARQRREERKATRNKAKKVSSTTTKEDNDDWAW